MIIIDPVTLADTACTRASTATYYDRNGVLQTAPTNTLRVTYDPSDLSKAPYALVEGEARNLLKNSEGTAAQLDTTSGVTTATESIQGFSNSLQFPAGAESTPYAYKSFNTEVGVTYVLSLFVQMDDGGAPVVATSNAPGSPGDFMLVVQSDAWPMPGEVTRLGSTNVYRVAIKFRATTTGVNYGVAAYASLSRRGFRLTGYQLEGDRLTSYIPSGPAPVTRAADAISASAGLAYSNVAISEPNYSAASTYAKGDKVHDPATHLTYESLVAANTGNPLSDATKWLKLDVTNRWKMLDQYNNTQTTNADEILLVVSPRALTQGIYLGNLDANEVRISVTDLTEGVVYRETRSLVVPNSGSSFYNWCFRRIKRNDYFVTTSLPPYANALITISIRKDGGTAKCGMCAVGPIDEFGPSLYGLSTEGKDYSSTTFNFDGTSSTVVRPYAKRMSVDVQVENDQIDYVQGRLFEYRQKPIVWIGGPYGSTAVFGRYGSFKNVIEYQTLSKMALTIEGSV